MLKSAGDCTTALRCWIKTRAARVSLTCRIQIARYGFVGPGHQHHRTTEALAGIPKPRGLGLPLIAALVDLCVR
jgi:hypothetical protein